MMEEKTTIAMFGHTLRIWQGNGRAVMLQVDDLYILGDANEDGNLVLPHSLIVTPNREAAEEICAAVDDHGSSIASASAYLRAKEQTA